MPIIRYVEIEHFKAFENKIRVELGHPAVLIGPNNSGKTSVIQAITLWSQGVKSWYEKKGETKKGKERERYGAGMTLLALKGEVSSFCEVWILCGSIPPINKI
jgi:predicted ATPase